jgi:hypothetical protein
MAQQGYTDCSGCGRMFKLESATEMEMLDQHSCADNDDNDDN